MKLKASERKALELMRRLDTTQRKDLLDKMQRQVVANKVAVLTTVRAGRLRKYQPVTNPRVERVYGFPPGKGRRK